MCKTLTQEPLQAYAKVCQAPAADQVIMVVHGVPIANHSGIGKFHKLGVAQLAVIVIPTRAW